ncbi:MAG TPA: RidA family protein [Dongiaceae bacterium]|nr:RidA family protein [Dongiaceae bacterium]
MLERLNPSTAPKPFSRYSQAVKAPRDCTWLYISGQVGCDRERNIADGFEAQAELAWNNLLGILKSAGFGVEDLVKVTVLLTRPEDVPASRMVRDRVLGHVEPASTLMIVSGLASPALLFEVEGVAARSAGTQPGRA